MVVGTPCDQGITSCQQLLGHGLGISQDLALVGNKLWRVYLQHVSRNRSNLLVVRATLKSREDSVVYLLWNIAIIFPRENHTSPRSLK